MNTKKMTMMMAALCAMAWMPAKAAEKQVPSATTVVRSSMIDAVFYDYSNRTLTVFFRKGGTYEYLEVPRATYEEMIRSASVGRYYHASIRGHFTSRRLDAAACAAFTDAHEAEARW